MMFALNYVAVRYGLKSSVSNFMIHIKKPKEERGAGGGTVRLWSAVPSPGHKKTKDFKLNQGITKDLNFISLFIIQLFSRGRGPSQTPKFLFPASPTLLGWGSLLKFKRWSAFSCGRRGTA